MRKNIIVFGILAGLIATAPAYAADGTWRARADHSACSTSIEQFMRDHGKQFVGRPIVRNEHMLIAAAVWRDGTPEQIFVAQRGDQFCVVAVQ